MALQNKAQKVADKLNEKVIVIAKGEEVKTKQKALYLSHFGQVNAPNFYPLVSRVK
jgi:hypothetical protein